MSGTQIYLNGKLIRETRPFDANGRPALNLGKSELLALPPGILKQGANILAIRTASQDNRAGFRRVIFLGPSAQLQIRWTRYVLWNAALAWILLFVSLYFFLYFIQRREDIFQLYFAGMSFCLSAFILSFSGLAPFILDKYSFSLICSFGGGTLIVYTLVNFIISFFDFKKTWLTRVFEFFFAACFVWAVFEIAVTGRIFYFYKFMFKIFINVTPLGMLYAIGVTVKAARQRKAFAIRILAGLIIFFLSQIYSVLVFSDVIEGDPISNEGYFVLTLIFATALARRSSDVHRDLEKAHEDLLVVDRLKDEFLSNTSHELRTPLNGIIGIADSLVDGAAGPVNDAMKRNLLLIVSSGRRLTNLVNDILDFQKLRHHDIRLSLGPVNVHAAVEVVVAVSRPLLGRRKIELINEIPQDLPGAHADENRVQQILHNLVGNALKFTEEGSVLIGARETAGFIEVKVSDTGIGIPPSQQARVFESFEQADPSAQRAHGGTGLGLSITKQLVELHGGTIRMESEPNRGSTFWFTLPVSDMAPDEESRGEIVSRFVDPPRLDEELPVTGIVPSAAGGKRRALVVDDEMVNRQTLLNMLTLRDFEVIEASNGAAALELVRTAKPDVVLLDVMMPQMSGYEVCRRLRENYQLSDLPVIMLTAKNRLEDLIAGFENGANDYVAKPFSKLELLARISTQASLKRAHNEAVELRERILEKEKMAAVGTMAASIVHDFKNPITIIKGYVEMADDGAIGREEQSAFLSVIEDASDRMLQMAQDILDFSKGSVSITMRETDLGEYLKRVRATLEPNFAVYGLGFSMSGITDGTVRIDPDRFLRAMVNIAGNAADAMGSSGHFRIEVVKSDKNIVFRLSDNGPGIPEDIQSKLFEPFTTGDKSRGTGLGMAITRKLVAAHNGTIDFETGPGGTTFIIEIPGA